MTRYIKIEEIVFPGLLSEVPKKRWTEDELAVGYCGRTEDYRLNTGTQMVTMLVHPIDHTKQQDGSMKHDARPVDFARMRLVQPPLNLLDPDGDGECELPIGTWVELTNEGYALIWEQAKDWPWAAPFTQKSEYQRLLLQLADSLEKAPEVKPLELEPNTGTTNTAPGS